MLAVVSLAYLGGYLFFVQPQLANHFLFWEGIPLPMQGIPLPMEPHYRVSSPVLRTLFEPLVWLDRWAFPRRWLWEPSYPECMMHMDLQKIHEAALGAEFNVHDASMRGHLEKVKALLKDNPNVVFSKDNNGETPLHWAVLCTGRGLGGHKAVAELLLANKAEVNAKDTHGETPLHKSAFGGHKDVVELLLAHGAEVNAKDINGRTPLHEAAFDNDVVELLLASKAEVNAKDSNGRTPLHKAVAWRHKDVAELLRQHGGHE